MTGADDAVRVEDLNALAHEYPFVEWAILCMPENAGQKRFPSAAWIKNFNTHYTGAHKAMHLCGSAFLDFITGSATILALMKGFHRIQLNLEFGGVKGKYDPQDLIARIKAHPEFEFIIQYTDKNEDLLPALRTIPHHVILFDQSAGRGIAPQSWPAPIAGHTCGYAGGITPDNAVENITMIAHAAGDTDTWIDMESGIRTDDNFDLKKVRQVLSVAAPWVAVCP